MPRSQNADPRKNRVWQKLFLPFSEIPIHFRKSHKISANLHKPIKSYSKLNSPWANLTPTPQCGIGLMIHHDNY